MNKHVQINCKEKLRELEKNVIAMNVNFENGSFSTLEVLEHIDDIDRLGLGYRFQNHIRRALDTIITPIYEVHVGHEESLHEASLRFRIHRQHGYTVSQDFLGGFKESQGGFIGSLQTDVKGLLSLYEASHLGFMEESELHEAMLFAREHLLKQLKCRENDAQVLERINRALEVPLFHRMLREEARYYIDAYNKREDANLLLLELATLDFNMIQATLKTELKEVSKWWENMGLAHKLGFVRDRLMECFFCAVGMVFEPQYRSCRVGITKAYTLVTVIDDIYDIYGSLDELEMFTDAVKRTHAGVFTSGLQSSLQYDNRNEFLYTSIGQGEDILPILVKVWVELFEAFLLEAKWTHNKHIPTLEVYLDNAWRSVSGVVLLTHGYFLFNQEINRDVVESLDMYHDLMKWSSVIFRLYNDWATSSDEIEQGKTANAISCYMHENDVSEEVARKHIKTLIDEAWRKLIKVHLACTKELANPFIDMAINLARISLCTYQYGDGHGAPDARARDQVSSVIIEPLMYNYA
ncbi:putative (E)-beta-ocimene synthase [Helianthus annuus]|nr:putative (E)-beta-ocimene synthase [Helianthus annuus]KAJ0542607.1 putative (E)-beta-ocimene synthase [Helianthus annuus]KAJ0711647.1 putative (E)-beta-ocimene synthase [Helianthus annuus]KAJ0798761.1 putative (E)-beta-ocimene synthase [Helianthus annuus]